MKIAYISIINRGSSGILKAIEDKSKASQKYGLNFDFYLLNRHKQFHQGNLYLLKKSYNLIPTLFFKKIIFDIYKFKNIDKLIDLEKYDAIVLRYPLAYGIGKSYFLKKYGYKIYTEYHGDVIGELLTNARIIDKLRAYFEMIFAGKFLAKISGVIGVTDEIRKIQLKNQTIPSLVVANGINPDSFKQTKYMKFDGNRLKIIFIASEFFPWQGLEKLLELLSLYDDSIKIELYLVGNLSKSQQNQISNFLNSCVKIISVGSVYGDELDTLVKQMNLAVSCLALSKAGGMKEACPIKSREYIARNIPFIYAYKDTDLNGDELFAKKFDEDNISINSIISFAEEVSINQENVLAEFEKCADKISWKNKLLKIKKFISDNQFN